MRPALHLRAKKAKFSGCQSKKSSCSFLTNSDMMFQGKEAKKMIDFFNCPKKFGDDQKCFENSIS